MLKRLFVVVLLATSPAFAQINNRGIIVKDEGSQIGFARSVNFVGSTVSCGISGGAATCTFTAPTVTITAGVTPTSGCNAGGFLYSLTSLVRCGALMTTGGTSVTITASPAGPIFNLVGSDTAYGSQFALNASGGGGREYRIVSSGSASGLGSGVFAIYDSPDGQTRFKIASTGATTVGTSGLGTSVVPLTVTPGTGNTVNILKVTNSGGTPVWSIGKAGTPVYASGIPAVSNTSANSCGTTAATIAGTAETGIITVGATSGTSCTVTFAVAAPTRRQCVVTNETTGVAVQSTYSSTTVSIFAGTFAASDVLAYICQVY